MSIKFDSFQDYECYTIKKIILHLLYTNIITYIISYLFSLKLILHSKSNIKVIILFVKLRYPWTGPNKTYKRREFTVTYYTIIYKLFCQDKI